jgi:hypothetical protein
VLAVEFALASVWHTVVKYRWRSGACLLRHHTRCYLGLGGSFGPRRESRDAILSAGVARECERGWPDDQKNGALYGRLGPQMETSLELTRRKKTRSDLPRTSSKRNRPKPGWSGRSTRSRKSFRSGAPRRFGRAFLPPRFLGS